MPYQAAQLSLGRLGFASALFFVVRFMAGLAGLAAIAVVVLLPLAPKALFQFSE